MKPFNLEAAKAGKKLITRDGGDARFIAHLPDAQDGHRIAALANGEVVGMYENGRFLDDEDSTYDLFMAPEKRTLYVNVYASRLNTIQNFGHCSAAFDTHEGAHDNAKGNGVPVIAVAVPIEIEV
jgi:hypothetical protein